MLLSSAISFIGGMNLERYSPPDPFKGYPSLELREAAARVQIATCEPNSICMKFSQKIKNFQLLNIRFFERSHGYPIRMKLLPDKITLIMKHDQEMSDRNVMSILVWAANDSRVFANK